MVSLKCSKNWETCQNDSDCCPISGPKQMKCHRQIETWANGSCLPPKVEMNGTCYILFVNTCENDAECCSGNCEKPDNWFYGVCNHTRTTSPITLKIDQKWIVTISVTILALLVFVVFIGLIILRVLFKKRDKSMVKGIILKNNNNNSNNPRYVQSEEIKIKELDILLKNLNNDTNKSEEILNDKNLIGNYLSYNRPKIMEENF